LPLASRPTLSLEPSAPWSPSNPVSRISLLSKFSGLTLALRFGELIMVHYGKELPLTSEVTIGLSLQKTKRRKQGRIVSCAQTSPVGFDIRTSLKPSFRTRAD